MVQKNKQGFFKKNICFVLLLMILSIISISLFAYIIYNRWNTSYDQGLNEIQQETNKEHVEIVHFEGNYDRSSQMIKLRWSYVRNQATVKRVKIYLGSQELVTVTSYRSYEFSREQYGIPTGDNTFTLSIEQSDGTIIKQECNVFVDYVLSATQSVIDSQGLSKVTLTYQYMESHPVEAPRMILLDSDISYLSTYDAGTNIISKENGIVTVQTTYGIEWNVYQAKGEVNEQYSIRWSFKDISDSMDFTVNWNADSVLKSQSKDKE